MVAGKKKKTLLQKSKWSILPLRNLYFFFWWLVGKGNRSQHNTTGTIHEMKTSNLFFLQIHCQIEHSERLENRALRLRKHTHTPTMLQAYIFSPFIRRRVGFYSNSEVTYINKNFAIYLYTNLFYFSFKNYLVFSRHILF